MLLNSRLMIYTFAEEEIIVIAGRNAWNRHSASSPKQSYYNFHKGIKNIFYINIY